MQWNLWTEHENIMPVCSQLVAKLPILNVTRHIYQVNRKWMLLLCMLLWFVTFLELHLHECYDVNPPALLILDAIGVSTRDLIWDLLSDSSITLLEFKSDICTFAHTVTWETLWPKFKIAQFLWKFKKVTVLFCNIGQSISAVGSKFDPTNYSKSK